MDLAVHNPRGPVPTRGLEIAVLSPVEGVWKAAGNEFVKLLDEAKCCRGNSICWGV